MNKSPLTLHELQRHFSRLFGTRNAVFLGGFDKRIATLGMSVSDLQDAIRRAPDPVVLQLAFARVMSRIFCVLDGFGDRVSFTEVLAAKYPMAGCGYCHQKPCACGTHRKEHSPLAPDPLQQNWTLGHWCRHINELYGENNRRKGVETTLNRLFREVEEVRAVLYNIERKGWTPTEAINEFMLEIADVMAWVITCAYLLEIHLEKAVLDRYYDGCTSCHSVPCSCGPFTMDQVDWERALELGVATIRAGSHVLPR